MKNIKFPVKIKGDHSVDLVPLSIQWNIFWMLNNKFYHCYNYIVQKEISNRTLFSGWGFNLNSHWSVLFTQVFPVVIRWPGLAQCRWVPAGRGLWPKPTPWSWSSASSPWSAGRWWRAWCSSTSPPLTRWGRSNVRHTLLKPKLQARGGSFMPFMEMEAFSTFHSNFGFYIVNRGKEMAL